MNKKCIGAGLISLDILINDFESQRPVSYYTGGTCGNVMMILAYMGWDTYPMARLDDSKYTSRLLNDMKRQGVHTDFINISNMGKTPVIIQHNIKGDDGRPHHKFEFIGGNGRFFNFAPVTVKEVIKMVNNCPFDPAVFFFDRISPSSIRLASIMKEKGSLVVFEPSCKIDTSRFMECVMMSDIVKFSDQRISDVSFSSEINDTLFIQTLGESGLQFKLNSGSWIKVNALHNNNIIDTSGAGDWTTAAFLNLLFEAGFTDISTIPEIKVKELLSKAQQFSSLSCSYQGARGLMSLPWDEIQKKIAD